GSISLWTVVAAVQAVERSVDAHASRLLSLEHRAGTTEKKHLDCEKMVVELGNQLEGKLAALGTLVQELGRVQKRLENMENLLKNKNFWILQLPPGEEVPKVPAAFEGEAACFSAHERENLEDWQRELYRNVLRARTKPLISLDDAIAKPDLLSWLQRGESPGGGDKVASGEVPAEPTDCGVAEPSFAGAVKQAGGGGEEPCAEEPGATENAEFTELSVEDSVIHIKQEEELCAADQREGKAGEAPEEPCPGE
ncbi:ZN783 protein, partial [Syrrhaptes paradoxus]|nr:ZN783 protein [Syrrhaptes paradoxus]